MPDTIVVRNSNTGLLLPSQLPSGVAPAMPIDPHHSSLQASSHFSTSGSVDRLYLNQRVTGERADLTALYNNHAFLSRPQQYPTAAIHQALYNMQMQQIQREQSLQHESAERSSIKVMCFSST